MNNFATSAPSDRVKFPLCLSLLLAAGPARAAVNASVAPAGSSPEISALLADLPKWSTSVGIDAGIGYKDNLLLSQTLPEQSGFARLGVEAFLWHLPRGRTDYSGIVSAEQTRYFSGKTIDDETSAFAQLQWRYTIEGRFFFAYDVQGYYLNEIRDVSDTDVQRVVAEQQMVGGSTGPTVRWSPRDWGWLEVQAKGKRDTFRDGFYDAKIGEGVVRLGWKPTPRVELSAGLIDRRRRYAERPQYSLGGNPRDDTLLVIAEREREARLDLTLDQAGRWKSSTRVSGLKSRDNGSGYLNYGQEKVTQSLDWRRDPWRVTVDGTARRRDYDYQTVGIGLAPPARVIDEYSVRLRVERKISAQWTALFSYAWERSRSNDSVASYRVNEGLLGARWSWEK